MKLNDGSVNSARISKRVEIFLIVGTVIFFICLFAYKKYKDNVLKINGVYVIGEVVSISEVDNGYISTIKYKFNNKKYSFNYKSLPAVRGPYVYLLIAKSKPSMCYLVENVKVETCFLQRGYKDSSWGKIPNCFNRK